MAEKIRNLMEIIQLHLDQGLYSATRHATKRQQQRDISGGEIFQILTRGNHEETKDQYDITHQAWKYAIRGHTAIGRDIRVVVTFREILIVITVIEMEK